MDQVCAPVNPMKSFGTIVRTFVLVTACGAAQPDLRPATYPRRSTSVVGLLLPTLGKGILYLLTRPPGGRSEPVACPPPPCWTYRGGGPKSLPRLFGGM